MSSISLQPSPPNTKSIVSSYDFHQLNPNEQAFVLSRANPDFSKLSKDEQSYIIGQIRATKPQLQPEDIHPQQSLKPVDIPRGAPPVPKAPAILQTVKVRIPLKWNGIPIEKMSSPQAREASKLSGIQNDINYVSTVAKAAALGQMPEAPFMSALGPLAKGKTQQAKRLRQSSKALLQVAQFAAPAMIAWGEVAALPAAELAAESAGVRSAYQEGFELGNQANQLTQLAEEAYRSGDLGKTKELQNLASQYANSSNQRFEQYFSGKRGLEPLVRATKLANKLNAATGSAFALPRLMQGVSDLRQGKSSEAASELAQAALIGGVAIYGAMREAKLETILRPEAKQPFIFKRHTPIGLLGEGAVEGKPETLESISGFPAPPVPPEPIKAEVVASPAAPARKPETAVIPVAPISRNEIFSAHDFKVEKSDAGNAVTFNVKSSTGKALGPAKVLIQPDGTAVVETKPKPVSEESIRQRAIFHLQKKQAKKPSQAPVVKAPAVEAKPESPETVSPVPEPVAEVPETAVAPKEEPKIEPVAGKTQSVALHTAEQAPAGTVVYFWNLTDAIKGMTGPWEKLPDGSWRNNQHGQIVPAEEVANAIEKAPQTHQITTPQPEHIEPMGIESLPLQIPSETPTSTETHLSTLIRRDPIKELEAYASRLSENAKVRADEAEIAVSRIGAIGLKINDLKSKSRGEEPAKTIDISVTENKIKNPESISSAPEERKGEAIAPQEQAVLEKSAVQGNQTLIKTPSGDMPGRYAVVDVSALIPSHNPMTFAKNAGYPEGIQERSYHSDKHAQSRVIENAQKHDAAFLLNSNPDAINGPPVVGRSGIVYGGNGRSMSLARVYASGKGDRYRNALIESAPMFGIDSQSVSTMSHPVLVREIDDDVLDVNSKRRMVSGLNRAFTGGLTSSQRAVSAGQSISRQTLEYVDGVLDSLGDEATIKQAIDSRGKKILNMMLEDGAITSMELPQMTDHKTGAPNQRGREFIEQALLGSVLADSDTIDRSPKYALNKIMGALPALSRLAVRTDEWNFIPSLRQALNEYAVIKSSGEKVSDYLSNIPMFGERNPVVDALVVAIDQPEPHGIGMKPKIFRSALNRYVEDSEIDRPGQSILGVFEPPSAAKVFNETFGTVLADEDYGKWIVKSLLEDNDAENAKADSLRATQSQPLAPTRSVQDERKIEPISVEHRGKEEHITLGDQKYILSKSKSGSGYGIHRKGKYVGEAFDREDAINRIKIDADKGCK